MAKKKKSNPFPVELVVTRSGAGTSDLFYPAELTREEAMEDQDGTEERIAIYKLVKVLLPKTEQTYEEVDNE